MYISVGFINKLTLETKMVKAYWMQISKDDSMYLVNEVGQGSKFTAFLLKEWSLFSVSPVAED